MPRAQKPTPPPKPPPMGMDIDALRETFKDFPQVELLTRRFTDPGDPGSLPILLKDEDPSCCLNSEHQHQVKPNQTHCQVTVAGGARCGRPVRKWFVYWGNTAKEGRHAQLMAKAYAQVDVKQLRDEMDVADLVKRTEDNARVIVRRGDRGQEVLYYQPLAAWNLIKRKKREAAAAVMQSSRARRLQRAEALGRALGDEAGQTAYEGGIREETFKRVKTTLGAAADALDQDDEEA